MSNYSLCMITAMIFGFIGFVGSVFFSVDFDLTDPAMFLCAAALCDSIEKGRK